MGVSLCVFVRTVCAVKFRCQLRQCSATWVSQDGLGWGIHNCSVTCSVLCHLRNFLGTATDTTRREISLAGITVENRRLHSLRIWLTQSVNERSRDLTPICSRAAALPPSFPRQKIREKKTSGVSALVHATPGVTASRFVGKSANRTTPIAMTTITSVKFRWTP